MSTPYNILVPTDLSLESEYAVPYAHALARKTGARLTFVHVVRPLEEHLIYNIAIPAQDLERVVRSRQDEARLRLEHMAGNASYQGIDAAFHLLGGEPVAELLNLAKRLGSSLIVMATHGHSGFDARIFGSVCEKVVRMASMPVMVVKHPEHEAVRSDGSDIALKRVLCPIDFSSGSEETARFAAALVKRFGGSLVLAHVVQPHYENINYLPELAVNHMRSMKEVAEQRLGMIAEKLGQVPVSTMVLDGAAHRELLQVMKEEGVNMLVMGTRTRHRLGHGIFGSVAEKLLRQAPCPVISMHPSVTAQDRGTSEKREVLENQASLFFA